MNPQNTTMEFDVELIDYTNGSASTAITRIQNNIQSLFSRVRLMYGSTPIEDMINYNFIVRSLSEWTGTNQLTSMDQTSIAEGIGGVIVGSVGTAVVPGTQFGLVNVRQAYIQGIDNSKRVGPATFNAVPATDTLTPIFGATGNSHGKVNSSSRRYQISFALGLFNQDKLIPTKFMASQLAIEITMENAAACLFSLNTNTGGTGVIGVDQPSYRVFDVNLIPEILEFDSSYDALFLKGLREGGVPIKFASWHMFPFSITGSMVNVQIQERSRSVKALFAVQRKNPASLFVDSGASLFATNPAPNGVPGVVPVTLQTYQFRIGGRYFPAAPVQCSTTLNSTRSNGACEAYLELQKALNVVGDYRLSTSCNVLRWGLMPFTTASADLALLSSDNDSDYTRIIKGFDATTGQPIGSAVTYPGNATYGNSFASNLGSSCFAMAIDLETSNGMEISGLNAEEQSDISLQVNYSGPQNTDNILEVYSYFDSMIILRENNVLELIQ